jgi:hypothetical protein
MEILEIREAIESAAAASDAAEVERWHAWAASERSRYIAEATHLFAAPAPDLLLVRRTLNAWRYIERLVSQLPNSPESGGRSA